MQSTGITDLEHALLMNGFRQDAPVASGSRFLKPEDFGSIVSDQPISTRALDAYIVDTLPKVAARLGTDKVLGVDHTLWDTLALYLPQGIDLPDQVSQIAIYAHDVVCFPAWCGYWVGVAIFPARMIIQVHTPNPQGILEQGVVELVEKLLIHAHSEHFGTMPNMGSWIVCPTFMPYLPPNFEEHSGAVAALSLRSAVHGWMNGPEWAMTTLEEVRWARMILAMELFLGRPMPCGANVI